MSKNLNRDIHPTAIIGERVTIGSRCRIGAYSIVEGKVTLKDSVRIGSYTKLSGLIYVGNKGWIGSHCIVGHPTRTSMKGERKAQKLTTLANGCIIRSGSIIYEDVKLNENVELGHSVMIRENITVGSHSLVGTNSTLDGYISIGSKVRIQTGVYISSYTTIDDETFIGPCAVLLNDKYMMQKKCSLKGPHIHSGVSIGGNSVILPGVEVGEGSIIGSGAVVASDVPPRTIFIGVPAKKLKDVPSEWHLKIS